MKLGVGVVLQVVIAKFLALDFGTHIVGSAQQTNRKKEKRRQNTTHPRGSFLSDTLSPALAPTDAPLPEPDGC